MCLTRYAFLSLVIFPATRSTRSIANLYQCLRKIRYKSFFFQQTVSQWRIVFIIAAVNSIASAVIYLLFGTSKEQPWNNYGKATTEIGQEMQKLTAAPVIKRGEMEERTEATEKDGMIEKK